MQCGYEFFKHFENLKKKKVFEIRFVISMANEGGGKIKSKRTHGSKPYARRQSLLGRVYEFLKPSWLMEMVGSSNLELDNKDEEDEQDQHYSSPLASQNVQQPTHQHVDTPRPPLTRPYREPLNNRLAAPLESNFRQVSESTNSIDKREINGDDFSECSESTSGCSSMLPHPDKRDYQKEILQDGISHPVQTSNAWDKNKIIDKHSLQQQHSGFVTREINRSQKQYRGLWSIEEPVLSRPQPSAQDSSISFNVSAFGTSLLPENSSIFGDSVLESPFYTGKTKYGGAANHRKDRLQAMSPYYRVTPVRQQVKVKAANNSEAGEFGMTSNTARRILEVLEKMSTPLSDAKKIPTVNNRIPDTPLSFKPGFHKQGYTDSSNKINNMALKPGPPINSINTPNRAVISKNLQSLIPAKTINLFSTKKSNQNTSPSTTVVNVTQKTDSEISKIRGAGGKIKTSRSKENPHYSSKAKEVEEKVYEVQDLPQVSLPIKNLPQFNFESSTVTTTISSPVFAFSTPIAPAGPTCSITGPSSTTPFTFSSPLPAPEAISRTTAASTFSNINFEYTTSSSALKLKENAALETKGKRHEDSESEHIGFKPAAEMKSGSVSDVLSKDWANKFKQPEGSWQCPSCCINNKAELNSCAACETIKPQPKFDGQKPTDSSNFISKTFNDWECNKCHTKNSPNTVCNNCKHSGFNMAENSSHFKLFDSSGGVSMESVNSKKDFGDKFKPSKDTWECSSCFIRNQLKDSKCAACDSFKPGTYTAAIKQSNNSTTVGFGSQFAKPKDTWECDICLVLNNSDAFSCVACQSVKPANINEAAKEIKFSFKSKEDKNADKVGFVFGNINTSSEKAMFTFGNSTNNQNTEKSDSNSTPGFSFGAKTITSVSESNGFNFGKANSNSSSSTPSFQFGSTSTTVANTIFTKPSNSSPAITDGNSNSQEEIKPKESEKAQGGFPFTFNQAKKEDNQSSSTEGFKFSIPNSTTGSSNENKSTTGFSFIKPQNVNDSDISVKPSPSGYSFGVSKPSKASVTDEASEAIVTPVEAKQPDNNSESATKPSFTFGSQAQSNNTSSGFQFSFNSNGHSPRSKHKLDEDSGPESKKKIPLTSSTSGFSFASSTANTSVTTTTSTVTTNSQAPSFTFTSSAPPFITTSTTTTNSKNTTPIFSNTPTATTSASTFPAVTSISNTTSGFPFKPTVTSTSQSSAFSFTPATTSTSGFGTSTFTTPANSAPSFTFSAQPNAGQTANIASTTIVNTAPAFGFSFTNTVPASSGFAISTGTPVFGATTASSTPAFGTTTASATPVFGTTTTASTAPTFGTLNNQGSAAPTFGFANPTTTAAPIFGSVTPSFGSTNSGAFNTGVATSSSAPFGSLPSVTTAPAGFPFTSTSSFTFGQQSGPSSVFSFSGNQAPVAPAPVSQQQPAVSFNFGNQPNLSSTPNFNFGATQQTSAPFQFSATPTPPSNPFSISNTGPRRIKKAVRKLRK